MMGDLIEDLRAAGRLPEGWDDEEPADFEWWIGEFCCNTGWHRDWFGKPLSNGQWITVSIGDIWEIHVVRRPNGGLNLLAEIWPSKGAIRYVMAWAEAQAAQGIKL